MKVEVFLGWLAELEATSAAGAGWLEELVAPTPEDASATPRYEHWRVFATLAAMPLRSTEPALNRPS